MKEYQNVPCAVYTIFFTKNCPDYFAGIFVLEKTSGVHTRSLPTTHIQKSASCKIQSLHIEHSILGLFWVCSSESNQTRMNGLNQINVSMYS